MSDTRSEIVRLADKLIRTKGYNAFSYTDISKTINIKNATIHYYFPSKSDLGVEVIRDTILSFKKQTVKWFNLPYEIQLSNYVAIYEESNNNNWVCVMGALCPVCETLSEDMQLELKQMADVILGWLTDLLDQGRVSGIFYYTGTAKAKAYLIQSSLLASLLLNKVIKNENVYKDIQDGVLLE